MLRRVFSFFVLSLLFVNIASSRMPTPSFELDVDLKKDEVIRANIIARKDSQDDGNEAKQFTLRWTLYRNEGLVLLVRYDNYPYQFILYKQYMLNAWRLNLLDTQGVYNTINQPYLTIYFVGIDNPFNDEKTVAHLKIYGFGEVNFSRE
ncbi:hypothetical protein CQA66_06085 [Helicobacter aurati]|uniref:Uncharacterized protein n=1 Tax=Helicobacter aurati TaxID=137778 RepID=A0A3D8J291_9HELI|nr:hypothetical protein [Helicobacter aurati]RDU71662.1 hypothetical protein CQA66_06085 [Helicobacter aurati]